MNYIIKNCPLAKECDCRAIPEQLCALKQAIAYCDREKDKNPRSEARTQLQMGKIILADEVFKILGVNTIQ